MSAHFPLLITAIHQPQLHDVVCVGYCESNSVLRAWNGLVYCEPCAKLAENFQLQLYLIPTESPTHASLRPKGHSHASHMTRTRKQGVSIIKFMKLLLVSNLWGLRLALIRVGRRSLISVDRGHATRQMSHSVSS